MKRKPFNLTTEKRKYKGIANALSNGHNLQVVVLFSLCLLLTSCKKEEEAAPSPAPSPTPAKVQLKVKINGSEYTCNTCYSSYLSGGLYGVNFAIGTNGDRFIFNFNAFPPPGTYSLIKFGDPSFNYQKNNTYFRGRGSLTITNIDTSANGSINKLAASFSCTTDTTGQEFFQITEGQINVNTP